MNRNEFDNLIQNRQKPLVVEFWAPWCGPCKSMAASLEKVAKEYELNVDLIKINADDSRELLRDLKIFTIPAILGYWQGKLLFRISGAQSENSLHELFAAALKHEPMTVSSLTNADRIFRLVVGSLLVLLGLMFKFWIVLIVGVVVLGMAIYDRCPIIQAIIKTFKPR